MAKMLYTTLPTLKNFLGIPLVDTTQDAELTALITQATDLVDIELGDNLEKKTYTRRIDGNGHARILMENRINSVASVTDIATSETIAVDFIEGSSVYLMRETPRGRRNIEITYEKGYATRPDDMERFFLQYCRELITMGTSGDTETVKSQSLGGGLSLTYFSPSELSGQMVDIESVIGKYRNFSI